MRHQIAVVMISVTVSMAFVGCGVKGQPQVPEYSPFIGKGLSGGEAVPALTPSPTLTPAPPVPTPSPTPSPTGQSQKVNKR